MPELAEVAYFAKQWDGAIGQKILRVHAGKRDRFFRHTPATAFVDGLAGTTFIGSRTHGKNMLFEFSGGMWLTGHLGMTGELLLAKADHFPGPHEHLVLFTDELALIFRDSRIFGGVKLEQSKDGPHSYWQNLPPEILSDKFTTGLITKVLERHARTPLKPLLLEQKYFPGIGNWMADEVLFQMKLTPTTLAGSVSAADLRKVLRMICRKSMATIGRDYSDPPKSWLMRYRWREGGDCPGCGTKLVRKTIRGRTACWCPVCQPSV